MELSILEKRTHCSPALEQLIRSVRDVVQSGLHPAETGAAVAELLRPWLGAPEFLTPEQMEPTLDGYCQHVLHVESDGSFSVVSLVWLPG
ncbi:MAG: cysteine dioxygenase, partial [Chthoniobacterales bacterium]|nr:cysteine dioxygenase [Chthoniobacterales bacterium]